MRLELIGKHKATLEDVDVQSQKMGQTDIKPAACLHFKVSRPNTCLSQFGKSVLAFLYTKNGTPAKQQTLDGVPAVAELSQLTDEAIALGALSWDGEQTGCVLYLHHGIGDDPKITLRDGTTSKYKTVCHQGGTVDTYFRFYTTDLDAETLGEIAFLKSHDIDIELTAPEAISEKQQSLPTGGADTKTPKGTRVTPPTKDAKNPMPVNADGSKNADAGGAASDGSDAAGGDKEPLTPEEAFARSQTSK